MIGLMLLSWGDVAVLLGLPLGLGLLELWLARKHVRRMLADVDRLALAVVVVVLGLTTLGAMLVP